MQVVSMNSDEIEVKRKKAAEMATELDKLFAENSMRDLVQREEVVFAYSNAVMSGLLGEAYKQGTIAWARGGALNQLMRLLDRDVPGRPPKFCAGSMGSVWFDVNLTGGEGSARRTKKVRVTPIPGKGGKWTIILDNTFEEVW